MKTHGKDCYVDRGENPGGCSELRQLLYPFYGRLPKKAWSKFRWELKKNLSSFLPILNGIRARITVVDRLGAPGDALLTSVVIHNLKKKHPKLHINCITPHPELLELDPDIDSLNGSETFFSFDSSYWDLVSRKETKENVAAHSLAKMGVQKYEYKARFFLSNKEKEWGMENVKNLRRPLFTVNAASKEPVKTWPTQNWLTLIPLLLDQGDIVQLGDTQEPCLPGTKCLAGKLTMRESAAILSRADLHIGPDSLLMHVANGLDVPAVILMGGSRPEACLGYEENVNLTNTPACSPCWIHKGYETCSHEVECMKALTVDAAWRAVESFNLFPPHTDSSNNRMLQEGTTTTKRT